MKFPQKITYTVKEKKKSSPLNAFWSSLSRIISDNDCSKEAKRIAEQAIIVLDKKGKSYDRCRIAYNVIMNALPKEGVEVAEYLPPELWLLLCKAFTRRK